MRIGLWRCGWLLGVTARRVPGLCVPALPYRIARVTFTQARAAQANMKATRRHCIEGRDVRVYDGLLPLQDIHSLTAALQAGAFTRTESARPDTTAFRHWVLSIPMQTATQLPVYQPTLTAAGEFTGETAYRIYRCYCNYAAYGDMLFTHTDCPPGAGELTALWLSPRNGTWNGAAKHCFSIPAMMRRWRSVPGPEGWCCSTAPCCTWDVRPTASALRRDLPLPTSCSR